MPVEYKIHPHLECIFVTLKGIIEDSELLNAQREMFADPLFKGVYTRLIDGSDVESLAVDAFTVRFVAKAAEEKGMRRAALVGSRHGRVVFALMRMYENYAWRSEVEVFDDYASAVKWLAPVEKYHV